MLRYQLLFLFTVISLSLFSQNISESIYSYKDSFNPLFSKEKSVLNIEFVKNYSIEKGDTSYIVIVELYKNQIDIVGMSLGTSVFKSNVAIGSSISYQMNESNSQAVMNKEQFIDFYSCMKKVHSYIAQHDKFSETGNSVVATCGDENMIMGGESSKGKLNYYFRIGNDSAYSMSTAQFTNVVQMLRKVKIYWESR